MAVGVPGRLRPRIISTFGTTRVVGRQPNAPAAFTPGEIPGTHFQRLNRPQGTWFCRKKAWKKSPVTPLGIDSGTVRLVAQHLSHIINVEFCAGLEISHSLPYYLLELAV